jgi:hypothetical protein
MRALKRFQHVYRTVAGREFHGEVLDVPETVATGVDRFVLPRRLLKVNQGFSIPVGTTCVAAGRHLLIADHGESQTGGYLTFKLFQVEQSVSWARKRRAPDPVTSMPRDMADQAFGNIWCVLEPTGLVDDAIHVPQKTFRMITGAPVRVDDVIGGLLRVRSVDTLLGVQIAGVA